MLSSDVLLRVLTLLLIIFREGYWLFMERKADAEKPKSKALTPKKLAERVLFRGVLLLLCFQLVGLSIFPFPHNPFLQTIGFLMSLASFIVSILARKELGTNWAHASEHQIKKRQVLVTSGIYQYIRHPIYVALILSFLGGELVVESYLSIVFFLLLFLGAYVQGKREEEILTNHFGKEYKRYMQKSKMLIPFVF